MVNTPFPVLILTSPVFENKIVNPHFSKMRRLVYFLSPPPLNPRRLWDFLCNKNSRFYSVNLVILVLVFL